MGRTPYSTRVIPVPANTSEMILATPRPMSRGGDGQSALVVRILAGATTTVMTFTDAAVWFSDFEANAFTIPDRFNGLRLTINGESVIVSDHANAAGTTTITVEPALSAAPAVGSILRLAGDIPKWVSEVMLIATVADLRFNTQQNGLMGNGVFNTIVTGQSHMIVGDDTGTPGFPVNVQADLAVATSMQLRVAEP